MNQLNHQQSSELDLYNPLNSLFGEYSSIVGRVHSVATAIDGRATRYFFEAAAANDYKGSCNVDEIFRLDRAIKAVDAEFWQKAMKLTDVLEYMPADKRNDWHEQIRKHKTPPFEIDTVYATLKDLLVSRERFLAERVDGIFRNLSHSHVTNIPQGFGKRFIMGYTLEYTSFAHRMAEYIHDLRTVIAKFMGREHANSSHTWADLNKLPRDGQWYSFDGGAWKIRLYKIGTAHMEVHPEMAYRLNQVLAYMHPNAIPNEFRTPPKKRAKEFELQYDLLGFDIVHQLRELRIQDGGMSAWGSELSSKTQTTLEYIGGVNSKGGNWEFDYNVKPVITEICRSGMLPEQKSHQYYPTPEHIALRVVEWADIKPGERVLEPSAGQGAIADQIRNDALIYCMDISKLHCDVLKAKGYERVQCADFLKYYPSVKWDKCVLNPPFADKRAEMHVQHAAGLLREGGVLVAVLPASYKNKTIVDGMNHEYSEVLHNEFQGCSVNVVILRLS